MKPELIKETIHVCIENDLCPQLVGHRGMGKTEVAEQYARERGYKFVPILLGQMADAGDLIGLATFVKNEKDENVAFDFAMPKWLREAIDYAENNPESKSIIFLDEITRAPKDLIQAIFQLVNNKQMNGIVLPPNIGVISAANPDTKDYIQTNFKDSAFRDRFVYIKFEPTANDWLDYAKNKEIDSTVYEFFRENQDMLDPKLEDFALDFVQPSRRSAMNLAKVKTYIDNNKVNKEVLREISVGLLGLHVAQAYIKSIEEQEKLLDPKVLVNDFKKIESVVKQYSEGDVQRRDALNLLWERTKEYIASIDKLDKKQERNLVKFILTVPKDFSIKAGNELIQNEAGLSTELNEEFGLSYNETLCKHLLEIRSEDAEAWKKFAKENKEEVKKMHK